MKYQIFTHNERESEAKPFTAELLTDPAVAIETTRELRKQLDFDPQVMLLVRDEDENLIYHNFVENGLVREWIRPGVVKQI